MITGNPQAFPSTNFHGMTLRDYFAGLSMQGMVNNNQLRVLFAKKGDASESQWQDIMAKNAYVIADAMLKQREL